MTTKSKKKRRTAKQSWKEFTRKTRVYDLLKAESHAQLKLLVEKIRPYVRDGDTIDWKHLCYIEYDDTSTISMTEFILIIAEFIKAIDKGKGLKCKLSVFVRYLASNEHSNFHMKSSSLNTKIYRMLAYIDGNEKGCEKL